jgi:energy-coupling factor transporter transmembrane protein EcfT
MLHAPALTVTSLVLVLVLIILVVLVLVLIILVVLVLVILVLIRILIVPIPVLVLIVLLVILSSGYSDYSGAAGKAARYKCTRHSTPPVCALLSTQHHRLLRQWLGHCGIKPQAPPSPTHTPSPRTPEAPPRNSHHFVSTQEAVDFSGATILS